MTDEPQAESLPPPSPPAPSSTGKAFLAGLAGGALVTVAVLAAGAAALPKVTAMVLGDFDRRLLLVERAGDDLHSRLATLEQTESRNTGATMLQNLTQRLAALESEPRGSGGGSDTHLTGEISRLGAELEAVKRAIPPEGVILRLADKAEQAQKDARQLAERNRSAQALLLVVGQLREAVNRGDSFEAELRATRRLAPAEDMAELDSLGPSAATGIPRRETLLAQLPAATGEALRAAMAPPDGDIWQRSLNSLTRLFSLRRVDGKGSDLQSVVARAENGAKEGDLAKAADELASLDGEPGRQVADWLKSAKARITADKALSALAADAAAESAKLGG